jgi:hypothetical protein
VFPAGLKVGVLLRDGMRCAMDGADGCPGGVARDVNHRRNRGAGGGGDDTANNACTVHSVCNGLLESSSEFAGEGRRRGVKLVAGDDPERVPYWSPMFDQWTWLRGGVMEMTGVRDSSLSARDERWMRDGLVQGG